MKNNNTNNWKKVTAWHKPIKPKKLEFGEQQMQWNDFLAIKASQRGVYLDQVCLEMLNNDHLTALMLSQILYWYTPNDRGQTRLGVFKNGHEWLVKKRTDWINEPCRLSDEQAKRSLGVLKKNKLIITEVHRFNSLTMTHIRLNIEVFLPAYTECATRLFWVSAPKAGLEPGTQSINRDYLTENYNVLMSKGVLPTASPSAEPLSTARNKVLTGKQLESVLNPELGGNQESGGKTKQPNSILIDPSSATNARNQVVYLAMVKHFFKRYEEEFGTNHPMLSKTNMDKACSQIANWFQKDFELFESAVDDYFKTDFKNCDYRIMHFVQDGIIQNRIFNSM